MTFPVYTKFLVIVGIFVIIAAVLSQLATGTNLGKFKKRQLMTDNELEFFFRLTRALPDYLVFPQVSMQALIEAASDDRKTAYKDRLRIAQQRVDYVISDPAGAVVAVIELDDKTHSQKKDAVRDARLRQTGIKTLRYQSKAKPSSASIRNDVIAACQK
jgi:very-short-patch-repair endonuclease